MASPSNRDRVLHTLRHSSRPLDDDELSRRSDVAPRQAVNQICRALEEAGVLRRVPGPDGKIVNELRATEDDGQTPVSPGPDRAPAASPVAGSVDGSVAAPQALVERAVGHEPPPGSSHEQRAAERVVLDLLGRRLGVDLEPGVLAVPSGARVEVDGTDPARSLLVECWAHIGPPKSAQRHKVHSDALKLTWISQTLYPRPRLVLCFADREAAAPFLPGSRSWAAQALRDLGIAVEIVELPDDLREQLKAAQRRQYR